MAEAGTLRQGRACVVCGGALASLRRASRPALPIDRCSGCGLWCLHEPPSDTERLAMYGADYFDSWSPDAALDEPVRAMKRRTFARMLEAIERVRRPGRFLDIGCALGSSLEAAGARGWDVMGLEVNPSAVERLRARFGERVVLGDIDGAAFDGRRFDAILLSDVLEHLPDPRRTLQKVRALLEPGGVAAINTPCVDSLSARLMGRAWPNLKPEHLFYFSRSGLRLLLAQAGFRCALMRPGLKALSVRYLARVMSRYPVPVLSAGVRLVNAGLPLSWVERPLWLRSGDIFVVAVAGTDGGR